MGRDPQAAAGASAGVCRRFMFRRVSRPTRPHSARRAVGEYNRRRASLPKVFWAGSGMAVRGGPARSLGFSPQMKSALLGLATYSYACSGPGNAPTRTSSRKLRTASTTVVFTSAYALTNLGA